MAADSPTILQIIPELDTGGAELSTLEIAEAICRSGGQAHVVTQGGRMLSRLESLGAKTHILPVATKNPLRMIANAVSIGRIIRNTGVDLVHARSRAPAWSGLWAARATGCRFVTTYHGAYNEHSAAKRFYNSVMARGDLVIANSNYTRDLIRSRYQTPPHRIRVVHRGVDDRSFDPEAISAERVARLRAAWGLAPGDRAVLQAARLTGWKGQSVVVEAARHLAAQGWPAGAVVILAGDDQGRHDYRLSLERAIAAGGLEGKVRLVGHVDDMPAAYRAAHAAVVASIEPEAFGRTAVEAQAMGCPVIATRIGAPQETVRAGPECGGQDITGWLVPPADAATLSGALRAVLALNDEERGHLGRRARLHVLELFTLTSMRRKTLAVYDELLGTQLEGAYVAADPQLAG